MKITRSDGDIVELRGRRQATKESGEEGLWLLWLVGVVFVGGAIPAVWLLSEGGTKLSGDRLGPLLAFSFGGIIGLGILGLGVLMALKREFLILDIVQRKGIYGHWSPGKGSSTRRNFSFDEVADITLVQKTESVSMPSNDVTQGSQLYNKLEVRMRVRPKTVVVLDRSKKHARIRELAERVAAVIQVDVTDRT